MFQPPSLISRDLNHIWHPCAQMKDFELCPPFIIHKARGSYLYTDRGPIIDAISSWWSKSLGHGHPAVLDAIRSQLDRFEHVIAANSTHETMVELGEKLAQISQKQHVFFASDGSSAVEIALKLALHAQQVKGAHERNTFVALKNSYHGETLGGLSVSDLGLYKKPYEGHGFPCHFIEAGPRISTLEDPLRHQADTAWQACFKKLEAIKQSLCAVIVEPIIQGAGGMVCYSPDFLKKLSQWARDNGIYFIADEIMTGMGRTGQWLACHHAKVDADLICLSKGLNSGTLPLSVVLIDKAIYSLFYEDYEKGKSFLHSHTQSGNALSLAAALATIQVMESENINQQAQQLGSYMHQRFLEVAKQTQKLTNIRSIGAVVAGDLIPLENLRVEQLFYQEALNNGALLRPIGKTLYWLPPLNTDTETIDKLAEITLHCINTIYGAMHL